MGARRPRPPLRGQIAHSLREVTGPLTQWPPPPWTIDQLEQHRATVDRACAFLKACVPATTPVDARTRELTQYGDDVEHAARVLRDAAAQVLAMPGFAAADTHPIPIQEAV